MIILSDVTIDPKAVTSIHTDGKFIKVELRSGNVVEVVFPQELSIMDTLKTVEAIQLAVNEYAVPDKIDVYMSW
jgi:hypothetical protein